MRLKVILMGELLQPFLMDELRQQCDVLHMTHPRCTNCGSGDSDASNIPARCSKPSGLCYCPKCTVDDVFVDLASLTFAHIAKTTEALSTTTTGDPSKPPVTSHAVCITGLFVDAFRTCCNHATGMTL